MPEQAIIHPTAGQVGTARLFAYAPRWSYSIALFRNRQMGHPRFDECFDTRSPLYGLLFDGAAFDTAEQATADALHKVDLFLALPKTN